MKILLVDRDETSTGLVQSYLKDKGHEVIVEPDRNRIFDHGDLDEFGAMFLDLSTQTSSIKFIADLKSRLNEKPYIVLMSQEGNEKEAYKASANAFLKKPVDKNALYDLIEQSQIFKGLASKLRDPDKNFPYHKGIISNTALNELFLASLDRTARYTENSMFLVFSLKNSAQIREDYGEKVEKQASDWVANHIIRLRRQSDIMAQTDDNEHMILIQRPIYKDEPIDAAQRFRASFLQSSDIDMPEAGGKPLKLNINIRVINLPSARKIMDETIVLPS